MEFGGLLETDGFLEICLEINLKIMPIMTQSAIALIMFFTDGAVLLLSGVVVAWFNRY